MSCVVPGCGQPPRYCDDCRDRAYEAMRYWDKRAHRLEAALREIEGAIVDRDINWKDPGCIDTLLTDIQVVARRVLEPVSAIGCTCDGIAPHKHWCPAAGYPPPPNMFCKHPRIEWGNTGLAESSCLDCGQLNPVKPAGPEPKE